MKQLLLLLTVVLYSVTFTACNNADDNHNTLTNSVWEATGDDGSVFSLSFIDESTCKIISSSNTGLYATGVLTFSYHIHSEIHSWPGSFGIFSYDEEQHLTMCYYGLIDGKKITLQPAIDGVKEYPVFQKKK